MLSLGDTILNQNRALVEIILKMTYGLVNLMKNRGMQANRDLLLSSNIDVDRLINKRSLFISGQANQTKGRLLRNRVILSFKVRRRDNIV